MSDTMILEKISIEFINSKIPSPSIDMSRPSRDPYHSLLKSQPWHWNPHSGSLCRHPYPIFSFNLTLNKTLYMQPLSIRVETE